MSALRVRPGALRPDPVACGIGAELPRAMTQSTLCRAVDRTSYLTRRRWWAADIDSLELPQRSDQETQIEARLNRKYLERALADLSQMQRRTIEYFYFDGLESLRLVQTAVLARVYSQRVVYLQRWDQRS